MKLIIYIIIFILTLYCSNTNGIQYHPKLTILGENNNNIINVKENEILLKKNNDLIPHQYDSGSMLNGVYNNEPFLRYINHVHHLSDMILLQTSEATVADAIIEADFQDRIKVSHNDPIKDTEGEDVQNVDMPDDDTIKNIPPRTLPSVEKPFNLLSALENGYANAYSRKTTLSMQMKDHSFIKEKDQFWFRTMRANVFAEFSLDMKIKINLGGIQHFSVVFNAEAVRDFSTQLHIFNEKGINIDKYRQKMFEQQLKHIRLRIGQLDLKFHLVLKGYLQASINTKASGDFDMVFGKTFRFRVGVSYDKGKGWKKIWVPPKSVLLREQPDIVVVKQDANIKVGFECSLEMLYRNIVGPVLYYRPTSELVLKNSRYDQDYWEEIGVGVALSFLGFDEKYQSEPIKLSHEKLFDKALLTSKTSLSNKKVYLHNMEMSKSDDPDDSIASAIRRVLQSDIPKPKYGEYSNELKHFEYESKKVTWDIIKAREISRRDNEFRKDKQKLLDFLAKHKISEKDEPCKKCVENCGFMARNSVFAVQPCWEIDLIRRGKKHLTENFKKWYKGPGPEAFKQKKYSWKNMEIPWRIHFECKRIGCPVTGDDNIEQRNLDITRRFRSYWSEVERLGGGFKHREAWPHVCTGKKSPPCAQNWLFRSIITPTNPQSAAGWIFNVLLQKAREQALVKGINLDDPAGATTKILLLMNNKLNPPGGANTLKAKEMIQMLGKLMQTITDEGGAIANGRVDKPVEVLGEMLQIINAGGPEAKKHVQIWQKIYDTLTKMGKAKSDIQKYWTMAFGEVDSNLLNKIKKLASSSSSSSSRATTNSNSNRSTRHSGTTTEAVRRIMN